MRCEEVRPAPAWPTMHAMTESPSQADANGGLIPPLLEAARREHAELIFLPRDTAAAPGEPWSFARFHDEVRFLAAALLASGLERGQRVGLFADNCRSWLLIDQALALAGLVSVPRGRDSAPAELEMIATHSGAAACFVEDEEHAAALREHLPELRLHVMRGEAPSSSPHATLAELSARGRELLASGEGAQLLDQARAALRPDDLLTIVYTSGTTGSPKGVMLSHGNVRSNVDGALATLDLHSGGKMLSILPAWHMYERIKEYVAIAAGCPLVYTDRRRLRDDLRNESPELTALVPRIWEQLAGGLKQRLDKAPTWKRAVLIPLFALGNRVADGKAGPLTRAIHQRLSRALLKPVWAALGGKLRLGVSGGGALPRETDRFLVSLGLPILQGYGLTETSPVVTVRDPKRNRAGSVGPALPGTEIQVRSAEGQLLPKGESGEIWVRGPQRMQGYFRDEERTRAVIDAEGWLHTGDLGHLDHHDELWITGRCKDTIVLVGGENVEPEPIECQLRTSPWIHQVVLVGQDKKQVGALIVPDPEMLNNEAPEDQRSPDSPFVREKLRAEIDRLLGPGSAFRPVDRVGPFHVMPQAFSYEDGTETATLKLRRNVIHERFGREIDGLFG
jgi:long-chain acyl-CoA synthetase